jgi:hypothetical protein
LTSFLKRTNMHIPEYWIKAILLHPSNIKWYFHWRDSLNGKRSPLNDELPWVTYRAIDWFSRHLTHEMVLFEWGSGGSTVFFSQRVKRVVTIEHNPNWHQYVSSHLERKGVNNISLQLVEPGEITTSDPWYLSTTFAKYAGKYFESYCKAIDKYSDGYFDVVMVDGRARIGCIRQALPKVKPGGFIVLDNSERASYRPGIELISKQKDIRLSGPGPYSRKSWETRIMQKQS